MANVVLRSYKVVSSFFRNAQNLPGQITCVQVVSPLLAAVQARSSSFQSSPKVRDINEYPEVEICKNPPEWKYVARILKSIIIPVPNPKSDYPSGWTSPKGIDQNEKYFVARTKNYMIPVYLHSTHRGLRRITIVRRIQGDIWTLEKELRPIVEKIKGRLCASQINEMAGHIKYHGDYVNPIKEYLEKKGF